MDRALELFQADPAHPSLRLHKLSGRLSDQWAFWAAYDLRIVCRIEGDIAELVTIGSHDDVY
jgi:mRNA-degrading endonuclease YafQ of YafQ-DinJ toxin-antitoxin module